MAYPKGYLVSIGGAEDKGDNKLEEKENSLDFLKKGILKNLVDLVEGKKPRIAVLTTATASPEESFRNYKKAFIELGCVEVSHFNLQDREKANDPKTIKKLEQYNAVMFSGGDQARLVSLLGGTALHQNLRERYQAEPIVIAGTSAGAAAMSGTMMNGGKSANAFFKGEIRLSPGFGFISNVIIDTHFDARGRFSRLAQAIAQNPGITAIGLSEDTGVIIEKGYMLKAMGASVVTIIEGTEMMYNNYPDIKEGAPISVGKFGVYVMSHSDRYDLRQRTFMPEPFKEHLANA